MNPNFPQNQSSALLDQQFNQAKSLYESGRFVEAVTVLENVLPSLQSPGERMLTAKTIVTIVFHDILKGYPQPKTSAYDKFRHYLNISLSNYDLAEEDYQRQYLYIEVGGYENELALHKNILRQMNQNSVIKEEYAIVKTSPVWHEREVFKAGRRIDYEFDILHQVQAIRNSSNGEPVTVTKGDERSYALLAKDNAKKVAAFAPGDTRVIDEVKKWAERTDVLFIITWRPSDGYELWVGDSATKSSTGSFIGGSMALGCLSLLTFPIVWIIAYLIVCFVAAGIGFSPARYFGQVVLVSLFGTISLYALVAALIVWLYMTRRKRG
jgi:hypothetical protein